MSMRATLALTMSQSNQTKSRNLWQGLSQNCTSTAVHKKNSAMLPALVSSKQSRCLTPLIFFCRVRWHVCWDIRRNVRWDVSVEQLLAKELVMSRNAKNRMYEGKAQLHSVQMQLQNQLGKSRKLRSQTNNAFNKIRPPPTLHGPKCLQNDIFVLKGLNEKCRRFGAAFSSSLSCFCFCVLRFFPGTEKNKRRFRCAARGHKQPATHSPRALYHEVPVLPTINVYQVHTG